MFKFYEPVVRSLNINHRSCTNHLSLIQQFPNMQVLIAPCCDNFETLKKLKCIKGIHSNKTRSGYVATLPAVQQNSFNNYGFTFLFIFIGLFLSILITHLGMIIYSHFKRVSYNVDNNLEIIELQ